MGTALDAPAGRAKPVSTSPTACVDVCHVLMRPSVASSNTANVRSSDYCAPAGAVSTVPDDQTVGGFDPRRTRLPSRLIPSALPSVGNDDTVLSERSTRNRPGPGMVPNAAVERTTVKRSSPDSSSNVTGDVGPAFTVKFGCSDRVTRDQHDRERRDRGDGDPRAHTHHLHRTQRVPRPQLRRGYGCNASNSLASAASVPAWGNESPPSMTIVCPVM